MRHQSKVIFTLSVLAILSSCALVTPQRSFAKRYVERVSSSQRSIISSSLNRAHSDEFPLTWVNTLSMLRGDIADLQLVVSSGNKPLTLKNFVTKSHVGLKVTLLQAKNISVTVPSGEFGRNDNVRSEGKGNYPDRLVPFQELKIPAKTSTTVWIDLETSADLEPGTHEVELSWEADGTPVSKKVSIDVLNSVFPPEPTYGNLVVVWANQSPETLKLLSDHFLSPSSDSLVPFVPSRRPKYWGTKLWSNANVSSSTMDRPPQNWKIRQRLGLVPPGCIPLNYTADEIDGKSELFQTVQDWGTALGNFGVKNLVVMAPDEALLRKPLPVDVFVSMPSSFVNSKPVIDKAKSLGAETWIYTATNQDSYSPKWLLDFPAPGFRVFCGAYSHALGATGTVYWAADKYVKNPLANIAYEHENGEPYHGDGILIYPGENKSKEPAPSSRLKWIRDGIMDYELLSRLQQNNRAEAKRVQSLVVTDGKTWSQDPSDWVKFHTQLRAAYAKTYPSRAR